MIKCNVATLPAISRRDSEEIMTLDKFTVKRLGTVSSRTNTELFNIVYKRITGFLLYRAALNINPITFEPGNGHEEFPELNILILVRGIINYHISHGDEVTFSLMESDLTDGKSSTILEPSKTTLGE